MISSLKLNETALLISGSFGISILFAGVVYALSTTGNIQDFTYTYDAVGNITQIEDNSITSTNKTVDYTYDDLSRLLTATSTGLSAGDYSQTYEYDEIGNLTYNSTTGSILYEAAHPQAASSVNGTSYTYDSNGNLTSNGTNSYSWDQENRLSTSGSKTFYYNAAGSRYKTLDSSTGTDAYTYYGSPYLEYHDGTSSSAGTPTYYIYAGSQRIASYTDADSDGTKEMYYYLQDHLGGTNLITDESGEVVQVYDYYPYGEELINEQPTSEDPPAEHSFTDKELDEDLGLYYFEARWYDAALGRFVSQDPAQLDNRLLTQLGDPQSLNSYSYARDNPVNLMDPTGELSTRAALVMMIVPGIKSIYYTGLTLAWSLQSSNPITSSFLSHSLSLNPGDVTITEQNQSQWGNVVDQIKGTDEFNTKINEIISNAEFNGKTSIGGSDGYAGLGLNETSDLKMSIGTAEMQVNGTQLEDGSWDLNVSVTDTYHFDAGFDYDSMAYNVANDGAATAQGAELITPYDETINFSTTHE